MIIIGEKLTVLFRLWRTPSPAGMRNLSRKEPEFRRKPALPLLTGCASVPEAEEVETLKWMIDCIQEVTDLPISLDSPSADVLHRYSLLQAPGPDQFRVR